MKLKTPRGQLDMILSNLENMSSGVSAFFQPEDHDDISFFDKSQPLEEKDP